MAELEQALAQWRRSAVTSSPESAGVAPGTRGAGGADSPGAGLVLAIDQFEEAFTLYREAGERDTFLTAVAELSRTPPTDLRVLIAVRAGTPPPYSP